MSNLKVICTRKNSFYFTIGKEYYARIHDDEYYTVENDKGFVGYFHRKFFSTIEEIRDDKLKQLGI